MNASRVISYFGAFVAGFIVAFPAAKPIFSIGSNCIQGSVKYDNPDGSIAWPDFTNVFLGAENLKEIHIKDLNWVTIYEWDLEKRRLELSRRYFIDPETSGFMGQ